MIRVSGVVLPENKRIDVALTKIFGVGRHNVENILTLANISVDLRVNKITSDQMNKIQHAIDANYKVEGDLRKEIMDNIKRLKAIGSYRGLRHIRNLPVRGQRTRSNARTKRGKRVTIGAMRKETRAKIQDSQSTTDQVKAKN